MPTATKAILFDLDGVLVDTEPVYTEFWEAIDRRFPTGVDRFAQVIKGSNLQEIIQRHFPDPDVQRQVVAMLDEFQHDMRYDFFDGALEFVNHLVEAGVPCALVTSSDNRKMAALFGQHPEFKPLFKAIVTGDMITRAKPDPECFILGARLLGVPVGQCHVFEDSLNGLRAGMASGATVIGLSTTLPASDIAPYCHHVVARLADALPLMGIE